MTTTSIRPVQGTPEPAATPRPARSRRLPNPLSAFSGFPAAIWVIFAGTVVNRIGFLVGPFLVFFLGSRGIAASQAPYVLGALGAGNLVGPAVGGWLADRRGRKLTMLAGLLGTAAAGTTAFTLIGPAFLWWSTVAVGVASIAGIAALGPAIDRRAAEEG